MDILYSGQAGTFAVNRDGGRFYMYRFGDQFSGRIDEGELKYIFGGAEDTRARQIDTLESGIEFAKRSWFATRATINLSILLSGLPLGERERLFVPNDKILKVALGEFAALSASDEVYGLLVSNICLQYAFFEQNADIIRRLEKVIYVLSPMSGEIVGPLERLTRLIRQCEPSLDMAKKAVANCFRNKVDGAAAAYRYLLKSEVFAELIVAVATELGNMGQYHEGLGFHKRRLFRSEVELIIRSPSIGKFDEVIEYAEQFLIEYLELVAQRNSPTSGIFADANFGDPVQSNELTPVVEEDRIFVAPRTRIVQGGQEGARLFSRAR